MGKMDWGCDAEEKGRGLVRYCELLLSVKVDEEEKVELTFNFYKGSSGRIDFCTVVHGPTSERRFLKVQISFDSSEGERGCLYELEFPEKTIREELPAAIWGLGKWFTYQTTEVCMGDHDECDECDSTVH